MILSHAHKFIFIKTIKTAGTSVEVDLNRVLGPRDVATPILPPVPGYVPQNHETRKWGLFRRRFYNHMPARQVRDIVGRRVFQSYFVFCVEREPVDKCISQFSMLRNDPHHNAGHESLSFDAYVSAGRFPIDTPRYTDADGSLMADRILRFETLAEDLRQLGDELGFEVTLKSRTKAGLREDIVPTDAQIDTIYKAFESSNRFTGYSRDQVWGGGA